MISIIICSVDPVRFAQVSRNYAALLEGEPHEIIGIHDARSLCEGYNRGVRRSKGDVLIFSHDDIEIISADFRDQLLGSLKVCDVLGVAGTDLLSRGGWISAGPPHIFGQVAHENRIDRCYDVCLYGTRRPLSTGIQAMDGVFFAASRKVVERVPFDEARFDGFHLYDLDFTHSAYRAGFRLAVCGRIQLIHSSGGNFDDKWQFYTDRFLEKFDDLPPKKRQFLFTQVRVMSRREVLEVMSPPHWRMLETAAEEAA
jgi:GT2 family glycosyltransferase